MVRFFSQLDSHNCQIVKMGADLPFKYLGLKIQCFIKFLLGACKAHDQEYTCKKESKEQDGKDEHIAEKFAPQGVLFESKGR